MFDRSELDTCPLDVLSTAIGQLAALKARTERVILAYIAAYERRDGHKVDGATSMTAWVAAATATTHSHAAEMVRVARSLEDLPAIADAYEAGLLSWDQVRILARFATPADDTHLAEDAQCYSLAQLQAAARRSRSLTDTENAAAHARRSLRWWVDPDSGWLNIAGRLPVDDGAQVVAALEASAESAGPDPVTGAWEPHESRLADALVDLVTTGSAVTHTDHPRAQVVLHVEAAALADPTGITPGVETTAPLDTVLTAETARRLTCDAHLEACIDDPHGRPLGVGRRRRTVPAWLARQVRRRDRSCRFPGCASTRLLHNHHIVHWAHGGPTDLHNLLTTCARHHRLLHEGGYRVRGHPDRDLRFLRPDGEPLPHGPPGLHPRLHHIVPTG